MRLEGLERYSCETGPLHCVDPRWTILGTLAYVVAVVATPIAWWRLLAAESLVLCFVVGVAGIPPWWLVRRWLAFVVLVGFLGVIVAAAHPERERLGLVPVLLGITAKNSLAFLAVVTMTSVVPLPRLLGALARLRVPAALVGSLHFFARYVHVLTEELDRMVKARRSRTFKRSGLLDWGLLTGLIGVLFVRAMERGERVHAAMIARGWNGTIQSLDGADVR
jgi:cobalt/nickel transport system permease protein